MTIFALVLLVNCLAAQDEPCDTIYTIIDEMPTFGDKKGDFFEYIGKNLKFKKPCSPDELTGVTWTINKMGKMVDVEVMGIDGECKMNVIKQINSFPLWIPGKLNGKAVCVHMTLPIHIRRSE